MKVVIPILWILTMAAARYLEPLPVILIASVTMAAIVVWRDARRIRELVRVTPRVAILAVVAAAAMVAVTYSLFPLLVRSMPSIGTETASIYARFLSGHSMSLIVVSVVPVIVAEELIWRGAFQSSIGKGSVLVTAAVYALAHAPLGSTLLVAVAFVCGLYWSALRAMSQSLLPAVCAHLAWDIALVLFPLVLRGTTV